MSKKYCCYYTIIIIRVVRVVIIVLLVIKSTLDSIILLLCSLDQLIIPLLSPSRVVSAFFLYKLLKINVSVWKSTITIKSGIIFNFKYLNAQVYIKLRLSKNDHKNDCLQ